MSVHRNIKKNPDSFVPCPIELPQLPTKKIKKAARVEAASIDFVQVHDNIGIAEIKFLVQ